MSTRDTNGNEIAQSAIVTIDLGARLPAPQGLTSTSLNAAIHLRWSSNAVDASHGTFDYYRVYSTTYDAARGVCTANWTVEGTTVSDAFLAGNLANGVARCFAVSAISRTDRKARGAKRVSIRRAYDAKNAFVYSTVFRRDSSGFLFFDDATRNFGVVGASTRTDLDFTIERHSDGSLWFAPARAAVTMALYSTQPVTELTSIDRAPATGFAGVTIEALPGYAYVFRIMKARRRSLRGDSRRVLDGRLHRVRLGVSECAGQCRAVARTGELTTRVILREPACHPEPRHPEERSDEGSLSRSRQLNCLREERSFVASLLRMTFVVARCSPPLNCRSAPLTFPA